MTPSPRTRRNPLAGFLTAFLVLSALVIASCHLGQETRTDRTLSLSRHYDSLSPYDSVVIEVEDPAGRLLAVVFEARLTAPVQLDNLAVPGWEGGPIVIIITGYLDGQAAPVYREEKRYDGRTRKSDPPVILLHPDPKLTAAASSLTLFVGQRLPLPQVAVHPANLANPALAWSTEPAGVAAVEGGELVGVSAGAATLRVRLAGPPARELTFALQVDADSRAPDRLDLLQDTLRLAKDGAPGWFGINVQPTAASAEVKWRLADSTKAHPRSDGGFVGRAVGITKVWAVSRIKPEVGDSGWISVGEPVPVASVRFRRDSLILYSGGTPESLAVEVLPALANPEVRFSLSDTSKATLTGTMLTPKAIGSFTVTVRSSEDTTKSHVLPVTVREPVLVTGVTAQPKTVTLYLGGPSRVLSAQVQPGTAPQGVRWKSLSPAHVSAEPATGEIAPLQAGTAQVVATSQADTTKRDTVAVTVKADAPRLAVRADTVVSAGATVEFRVVATQEFGDVKLFQWDLDGDLAWDESLTGAWTGTEVELPPVSRKYDRAGPVTARFRVQDSEGNFSAVAAWALRVVGGAAVTIDSPRDNAYTNQRNIAVEWSVNGRRQDSLLTETLAIGPNVITRTARDSAGKSQSVSITVHLDTAAPQKPLVSGTSPTNLAPKWSWSSGGGGGSGDYRFRLGDATFPADAPTTRDTLHALAASPVSGTTYTLYVQERDLAGNWSEAASLPIRYDVSSPVVAFNAPQASGTHYTSTTPIRLAGTATGPLAIAQVTYRVGAGAATPATLAAGGAWSVAALPLVEGSPATVTVTAEDQAGNKGEAPLTLLLDATKPTPPTLSTVPAAVIAAVRATFGWTAGSDGTAGSGLSGRYRYRLNGGAWKDTTAVLLVDFPLPQGSNTFEVQEQDRALLWSDAASRVVKVDTSGPAITLTGSNPRTSATTTVTLAGTVRDSSGGVTMTVTGQLAGSGTVSVTGTTWTTAPLTLASGANTLVLTAADPLENERTLSVVVNVNVPAPAVVITNPADSLTVTNLSSITVSYTIDGSPAPTRTFTLATDGVHRLVVESAPNVSGNIGRDTVKVTRDATPPLAPVVTRGTTPTNGAATWTWVSGGDNAGGAGMRNPRAYQYSLNGGTTFTDNSTGSHSLNTTDGSYTLVVRELDRAGNPSPWSAASTIVVDKTGPTVAITGPANNYVTSQSAVTLSYTVDGGATQTRSCPLTNANGSTTCSATATDGANNTGSASITVWRRSNVVFFTTDGAGGRTGVDWQNAMESATIEDALLNPGTFSGKEFWVGTGDHSDMRVDISMPVTFITGFNALTLPYNTEGRVRGGTRFGYVQVNSVAGVRMDAASIVATGVGGAASNPVFTDVDIDPPGSGPHGNAIYILDGATATFNNLRIRNKTWGTQIIYASGGILNLNGGSITGNTSAWNPILVQGRVNLSGGFTASGNLVTEGAQGSYQYRVVGGGVLSVASGTTLTCSAVIEEEGAISPCP